MFEVYAAIVFLIISLFSFTLSKFQKSFTNKLVLYDIGIFSYMFFVALLASWFIIN